MSKVTLSDVISGFNLSVINDNFEKVEDALQNQVLYRDNPSGEPNSMNTDLDMNGKRIYNLPVPQSDNDPARLKDVKNATVGNFVAAGIELAPISGLTSTNVQDGIAEVKGIAGAGASSVTTALAQPTGATLVNTKRSETGAVVRTVASKLLDSFNIKDFGAVCDGTTDDAAAIQAAINACSTLGGGYVDFPAGRIIIKSTLYINTNRVKLRGKGSGSNHNFGPTGINSGATTLVWNGTTGGTMIQINPVTANGYHLDDNGVTRMYLSSNGGKAAIGLALYSSCYGEYEFAGDEFTGQMMYMGCATGLSEWADPQYNTIELDWLNTANAGVCLLMDGSDTANTSFNRVRRVHAIHNTNDVVVAKNADNNRIDLIATHSIASSGSKGYGIRFKAGANNGVNARNNIVHWLASDGGAYNEGTEGGVAPAYDNQITFQDTGNGTPTPTVGPGANLWWGSNNAPTGMRASSPGIAAANAVNTQVFIDGRIRHSGYTNPIASGSSLIIPFPSTIAVPSFQVAIPCTFTIGTYCLGVTGNGNATFNLAAQVNNNNAIQIFNNSAVAATVWWFVEGK